MDWRPRSVVQCQNTDYHSLVSGSLPLLYANYQWSGQKSPSQLFRSKKMSILGCASFKCKRNMSHLNNFAYFTFEKYLWFQLLFELWPFSKCLDVFFSPKANHNNKNHLFTILSLAIFLWHRRFPNSLLSWNVKIGDNPHEEEEDELKKEDLSDFLLLWVSDFATRFSWFQVGWFLLQVRQVSVAAVLGVLLKGRHQIFLSIDGIPPVEE